MRRKRQSGDNIVPLSAEEAAVLAAMDQDDDDNSGVNPSSGERESTETIEIDLLLEGIRRRWGYDFTHYSHASVKRRLMHARNESGFSRFTELLDRLLHDEAFF